MIWAVFVKLSESPACNVPGEIVIVALVTMPVEDVGPEELGEVTVIPPSTCTGLAPAVYWAAVPRS